MSKKKNKKSGKKKTLPLAVIAPMLAQGIYIGNEMMAPDVSMAEKTSRVKYILTGVDASGNFHYEQVAGLYGSIVAGILIHKGANMLGINRALANAKVPLIRV